MHWSSWISPILVVLVAFDLECFNGSPLYEAGNLWWLGRSQVFVFWNHPSYFEMMTYLAYPYDGRRASQHSLNLKISESREHQRYLGYDLALHHVVCHRLLSSLRSRPPCFDFAFWPSNELPFSLFRMVNWFCSILMGSLIGSDCWRRLLHLAFGPPS